MRYAISYVSSVHPDLTDLEILDILNFSCNSNNKNGITGILLFSEGNFFQVLEGEKSVIQDLFSKINEDKRHRDLMVIFEKPVAVNQYENYAVNFLSLDSRFDSNDMDLYLSQINQLDPAIRSSVRYILNKFSEGIKSF